MRTLWLCVVIGMGLSLIAAAQPDLASDSRLQKPITVWLKMEPLGDALRLLSRETGVRLSCSSTIQAHKVAIFIPKERPAHEVLTQLARALRYEWRVREDENGYTLVKPDELSRQEQSVSRAIREARRQALQDFIQAAREYARKTSEELTELRRAQPSNSSASQDPKQLQRQFVLWLLARSSGAVQGAGGTVYTLPDATIVQCLAAMPPAAVNALLNGQWVGLSTRPARGIYPYPPNALAPTSMREYEIVERSLPDGQTGYFQQPKPGNPALVGVWLRLSPDGTNKLQYRIVTFTQPTSWNLVHHDAPDRSEPPDFWLNQHTDVLLFHLLPYVQEHPFLKEWREWSTPPTEWAERFPKTPTPAERPEPPVPDYHAGDQPPNTSMFRFTAADVLERVAWLTGMPVVADAFRTVTVSVSSNALRQPSALLRPLEQHCWLRFDESGYLLARTQLYWSRQRIELSEATLRALERKFKAGEWLDLRDYVDLAAALTPEQVETLAAPDGAQFLPAAECPLQPLVEGVRGLRFLASLSRLQYQRALAGDWLPASALSPLQKQRFSEALSDDFPPVQSLFTEIPQLYTLIEHNASKLALGGGEAFIRRGRPSTLPDAPNQPAFRLQTQQERVSGMVGVRENGVISTYFSSLGVLPEEAGGDANSIRQRVQAEIAQMAQEQGARFFLRVEQGYTLQLSAPPLHKSFLLIQLRHKPTDPLKATE